MPSLNDASKIEAAAPALVGLAVAISSACGESERSPDPRHLNELDSAITELEEVERLTRKVEATRVSALARLNRVVRREFEAAGSIGSFEDSLEYRASRADAATALRLSEQTIERHLRQADALAHQYADTLRALDRGAISYRHATIILDAGEVIGAVGQEDSAEVSTKRADFEAEVLRHAVGTTPNRLQPIARRIAEQFALEDLDTRFEKERRRRAVWVTEREDGMADLVAYLPAHEAYGIYSRLTQIAQRIESAEKQEARAATPVERQEEPPVVQRVRGEIRTDLLTDLLLNGTGESSTGDATQPGFGTGISGIVQVICQQQHVQATGESVGESHGVGPEANESRETFRQLPFPELEGYGPIPVGVARSIAGGAQAFARVTLHPTTADVMRVDRYRPSEEMRRFLIARDQHCRFPGCRAPAHRCDADHTVDAALGGSTSTDNLGMLCRGHHTLKHHTRWKVKQHPDGVYEWTSPTGRTHFDAPVSRVRFSPVPRATNAPPQEHEPTQTSQPLGTVLPLEPGF